MAKIEVLSCNMIYRGKDYKAGTKVKDLPAEMVPYIQGNTKQADEPGKEPEPTTVAAPPKKAEPKKAAGGNK